MLKMRKLWVVALGLAMVALGAWPGPTLGQEGQEKVKQGDVVAVCGDSITEQKQYSLFIESYLAACQAGGPIRTAQFGWSGDSMGWLFSRAGTAPILAIGPSVVTTCYGMNDGGYKPLEEKTVTAYTEGMTRLVQELKKGGVRLVVVGSPGVVDANTFRNNPETAAMYNKTLASLRDIARKVAQENGCAFANVYDSMMEVMTKAKAKYGASYAVAGGDGVHPGANGHLVMAYAFLKAMGCDGNIGTITLDVSSGKATASEGHKILSVAAGAVEVESSRYPFCFWGNGNDSNGTAGIIEFFPFNEDLNRFKLVVSGLANPDMKVRVTWGGNAKEFKAGELAKGINLAAEFLDNPFKEPFQKVRDEAAAKQKWETTLYKSYLSNLYGIQKDIEADDAEAVASVGRISAVLAKKDAKLAAGVAGKVTPVKHVIKVEVVK